MSPEYPNGVEDSAGCFVTAWMDKRAGNWDIYAQRIDAAGNLLWAGAGVAVCIAGGDQSYPAVVRDGSTGTIIVWQDRRAGNDDIYAQRLNANGVPQWGANGVAVCTAGGNQNNAVIVADGNGGALIAWQDNRAGNSDIYAQQVNAAGVALWVADGVGLCTEGSTQQSPGIVRDATDGAVVIWQDSRSGTGDLYAQRISGAGAVQWWAADGVGVCTIAGNQQVDWSNAPALMYWCSDSQGGIIAAWTDSSGADDNTQMARLDSNGVLRWLVTLCGQADDQNGVRVTSDGSGGAIAAWVDRRNGVDTDIYAQRVTAAGGIQWTADGLRITDDVNDQTSCGVIGMSGGCAMAAWVDNGAQIRGQKVDGSGNTYWTANGCVLLNSAPGWGAAGFGESGGGIVLLVCRDTGGGNLQDAFGQLWREVAAAGGGNSGASGGSGGCFAATASPEGRGLQALLALLSALALSAGLARRTS